MTTWQRCLTIWCCILLASMVPSGTLSPDCDPEVLGRKLNKQEQYECLVKDLFDPSMYSALVRPVANINDTLHVNFSVQLSQIVSLDEKNQVMKTNVWLQLYWTDYQLFWENHPVFGDVKSLRINPELVWRPDVVLFNNADGNYEVSFMSNVVIYSNGYTNWIPPAIYKSSCSIDVKWFPFDEQVCDLKFGSWTFLEHQVKFSFYFGVPYFDVSDYLENGAWDIVEGGARIDRIKKGNGMVKPMVIFTLKLRRKTLFYTVNLIIPVVLISFVTLSVFILPADAGEKITLCISILLALVVFLVLISKILPPSLTLPLVSQYLLFTFIMNILAIVSTVIVINRNYRTPRTHHMPNWVRVVFLNMLPRLMFMKRPDHDDRWRKPPPDEPYGAHKDRLQEGLRQRRKFGHREPDLTDTPNVVPQRAPDFARAGDTGSLEHFIETHRPNCRLNDVSRVQDLNEDNSSAETAFIEPNEPYVQYPREIYEAAESVTFIQTHQKKDDKYHTVIDDWRYAARVIDRLLLIIFLIVTICGTAGIFMKAPHIFETVDQDRTLAEINRYWETRGKGGER